MAIEVTSVRSELHESEWGGRAYGIEFGDVRVGGYGYLYELIRLLTQSPHQDFKDAGAYLAEATGLAVDEATLDLNSQILSSREREKMRDRQLSDFVGRARRIWEASQAQDHTGHRWSRWDLEGWLHGLAWSRTDPDSQPPTLVDPEVAEELQQAFCGDLDDGKDGWWSYDQGVLTFEPARAEEDDRRPTRRWRITATPIEEDDRG